MLHIVQMQCLPILTYGCCAWKISNSDIRIMCVCFNEAFKRIFSRNMSQLNVFCFI